MLASQAQFTEAELRAVHLDRVSINSRDLTTIAQYIRDRQGVTLSADAEFALNALIPWRDAGATLDDTHGGVAIAHYMRRSLRRGVHGSIVDTWGAGGAGLANFLDERLRGLGQSPQQKPTPEEQVAVDIILAEAANRFLTAAPRLRTESIEEWRSWYRQTHLTGKIPSWTRLGWNESLEPATTLTYGPLISTQGESILSQLSNCYTIFTAPADPDSSETLLAIGQSEHPGEPHERDQSALWQAGGLKASPLSTEAIERLVGIEREISLFR